MKVKIPYEVQIVETVLVLLCALLVMFMVSAANHSVLGAVAAVLALDCMIRYLVKLVKKC